MPELTSTVHNISMEHCMWYGYKKSWSPRLQLLYLTKNHYIKTKKTGQHAMSDIAMITTWNVKEI